MAWIDYREIRERVRIVELLVEIGWPPTKGRGDQLRGPCPLPGCTSITTDVRTSQSERTFSVQRVRNIYHCFRCGSQGSVIDFWSAYRSQPTHDAAKELWTKVHSTANRSPK
jgi:hypothetical protein